jgi:hypothetical protein
MNDIDRRVAELNPARGEDLRDAGRSVEAIALLQRVLAEPIPIISKMRSPHPRRRAVWATGLAAAVVAVAVIAVALWPGHVSKAPTKQAISPNTSITPNLQLVAFTRQGNDIVARITDPLAAADQLTAVFQAHGLDIRVKALPVSPSLVGTIVYSDVNSISSLHAGRCLGGGTSCDVGLVIPANFTGEGNVAVGRSATSGETFASSADIFGSGEVLHCTGLLGQPVGNALPVLQAKGLTVEWMIDGQRSDVTNAPGGYIVGGTGLSSATVLLDTSPSPLDTPEFRNYEAAANEGC